MADLSLWAWALVGVGIIFLPLLVWALVSVSSVGARAVAGAGGAGNTFFQNYGWLLVGIIIIPVGYWMLVSGQGKTLLALTAVLVAIFSFNLLMNNPPNSWIVAASVAAILLFASWGPTWNLLNGIADGYTDWANGSNLETTVSEPCGPDQFIEQAVSHRATTRFDARLECRSFSIYKPVGVEFELRYNGTGPWITWTSGNPPRSQRTIRFMDIRLAEAGPDQIVEVRFPR